MTSAQCLLEMLPLSVWTAGQDRDTSRVQRDAAVEHGRTRQTDTRDPDPVSWNGTFHQMKFRTSLFMEDSDVLD